MNFSTWIEQNKDKINWQPIKTLPWELDNDFTPPRQFMPSAIILRTERKGVIKYELIGTDISGWRSTGCSCCSEDWADRIVIYNAWAWAFGE